MIASRRAQRRGRRGLGGFGGRPASGRLPDPPAGGIAAGGTGRAAGGTDRADAIVGAAGGITAGGTTGGGAPPWRCTGGNGRAAQGLQEGAARA